MHNKKKKESNHLLDQAERLHKEVCKKWPKWKQVIFNPRRPRNGFKM